MNKRFLQYLESKNKNNLKCPKCFSSELKPFSMNGSFSSKLIVCRGCKKVWRKSQIKIVE